MEPTAAVQGKPPGSGGEDSEGIDSFASLLCFSPLSLYEPMSTQALNQCALNYTREQSQNEADVAV